MDDQFVDDLGAVVARWTMGGQAASLAPESIRADLGDDPDEAELRLLAIAGQALGFLAVPEAEMGLQGMVDLPVLPLPTMPAHLRPAAARILARSEEWLRNQTLRLIERRGYVVHPADWMPSAAGSIPEMYSPWQNWIAGKTLKTEERSPTAQWIDAGPSGRRKLLERLRTSDPAAARMLVEDRIGKETPDMRVMMVAALGTRLSEDDRPLLEQLLTNRAPRVCAAAARLLSRLGGRQADAGDMTIAIADIADFVKTEDGKVLGPRTRISLVQPRNPAQAKRRDEAMAALDLHALATVLDMTDAEVPGAWPWNLDSRLDAALMTMILDTGSTDALDAFEQVVMRKVPFSTVPVGDVARMSDQALRRLAQSLYENGASPIDMIKSMKTLGEVDGHDSSVYWRSARLRISRDAQRVDPADVQLLLAIGLLMTSNSARMAIASLTDLGVARDESCLDALHLSASL